MIDKGPSINKGPWPSVSFYKLPQMIQGTSGEVIKYTSKKGPFYVNGDGRSNWKWPLVICQSDINGPIQS